MHITPVQTGGSMEPQGAEPSHKAVDLYSTRIRLIAGSVLTFKFTQSLLMSAGRRARFRYVCIDTLAQWVLQASNCPNGIV
ncbi:hypothetical protein T11_5415 [Trichinella zimbabwensis]|uniref:Uncharacterized protein n=2 Tax=Trichinella TaxID=6333 RepID=A0A0V1MHE7_9BILA|nr:hypothetical protein T11_5415 [Trichinella zimbabwensis]KRZ71130.1 hypothetical protein T10_13564 [Trichinella papuae]